MPSRTSSSANTALLALALGGLGIGSTEFAIMGLLPQVANGLRITIPQAGHLISAYALGVVIGAPIFAVLTAHMKRKPTLMMLMSIFTCGNALSAFAPGYHSMMLARFLAGLPHGAYFGIAAVTGAVLAGKGKRGHAISMIMMGLTIANVISVPLLTLMGQHIGWRWAFGVIAGIGLLTVLAIALIVPETGTSGASIKGELSALKQPQIWLTLLTGMIGFGGFFAVYSYITPMMTDVTGFSLTTVTLILSIYGLGMTTGNFLGGKTTDWNINKSIYLFGASMAITLLLFTLAIHHKATAVILVYFMGVSVSAYTVPLQARLMVVAEGAQNLAASMNHSALNLANALGAWLGGLVIAAGLGYVAPVWVGFILAIAGLICAFITFSLQKKTAKSHK
ncbi:MAG: MFS transporter [Micrococcaceae bacterium]